MAPMRCVHTEDQYKEANSFRMWDMHGKGPGGSLNDKLMPP